MKLKSHKGFTLIELLVVVAIIGILASVVLAALGSARGKATEAKVKSEMSSMRAQAEIYYIGNSNSYGSATDCTTTGTIFTDTTAGSDSLQKLVSSVNGANGSSTTDITCLSIGTAWVLRSTSGTPNWCVDSAGYSNAATSINTTTATCTP